MAISYFPKAQATYCPYLLQVKSIPKVCLLCLLLFLLSLASYGQNSLTLSTQIIHSKIEVKDNWSPPTAVHRKDVLDGTAKGYGASLNYAFKLPFLIRDPRVRLTLGAGYFKQRFELGRPFDYNSQVYIVYYTDQYSYHCWQWSLGMAYSFALGKKYSLAGSLTYSWLNSFRQEYTPASWLIENPTQTNHKKLDFGNMAKLEIGVSRSLGSRLSLGVHAVVPLYTRWRNDEIFRDDPSEFSRPKFSIGSALSITYHLKKNHKL